MKRLKIVKPLGSGMVGKVFLVDDLKKGTQAVMKVIPRGLKTDQRIAREHDISKLLDCGHKNISCFLERVDMPSSVAILSEYIPGAVNLEEWTLPNLHEPTTDKLKFMDLLYQLADGLTFMHEKGVAHRDIKPANILIKENIPIYIDFDVSCRLNDLRCVRQSAGTPLYLPVESWHRTKTYTPEDLLAGDIYALGVTFYWLANMGTWPAMGEDMDDHHRLLLNKLLTPSDSGNPQLDGLIMDMLKDAPERPTASDVRSRLAQLIKHQT